MYKTYLHFLLLPICLLMACSASAQTFTAGRISVTPLPGASHDSVACRSMAGMSYMVTVASSFTGDSVKVVDTATHMLVWSVRNTTGASPWTFVAPGMVYNSMITDDFVPVSGGTIAFVGPVYKFICFTDTIPGIPNFQVLYVPNPCLYDTVSGITYLDNNSDCAYNTGDVRLDGISISSVATLSSPGTATNTRTQMTDIAGFYNMTIQKSWMTSYTVTVPAAYYFIFPPSSCFSGAYTYTTLPHGHVDFPMQCSGFNDVQCRAGAPPAVRENVAFQLMPYVSNLGCDTISGVLTLIKDSRVVYNATLSTNPATSVSGDTLRWNYSQLCNLTSGAYWNSFVSHIHLTPDTSVHAGDTLCFHIYTGVPTTDPVATNNDETICLPVVYSYDPNIKEVSPKGTGTPGYIPSTVPALTYTLHFQNTGTAMAIDVKVIDTLDADVTPSSLKILGTSHYMTPQWLAPGVVQFTFNNIYLPDSASDEAASHGFVRFSVAPHAGLATGTQIKNKGYIYFDANPPVITNTTLNTIMNTTGEGTIAAAANGLRVYPNPATEQLYVEHLQGGTVTIMTVSGSVVVIRNITTDREAIDISGLASGMYILKAVNNDNTTTAKFIRQ